MNAWCRSDSREPLSSWKHSPETLPIFDNVDISGHVTSAASVPTVFIRTRGSGHFAALRQLAGEPRGGRDDRGFWGYRGGIAGMQGGIDRAAPADA
jgi:hypothetical protein